MEDVNNTKKESENLEDSTKQKLGERHILLEQNILNENSQYNISHVGEDISQAEEEDKITLIGEFIRLQSSEHKLTNAENFLEEPIFLEVEDVLPSIDSLKEIEEYNDIHIIKGAKTIYLYSYKYISHNYANILAKIEEKDLLKLVAETVRRESKIYPRPTTTKLFTLNPFNFTKEQFNDVLKQLKMREQYKDIRETKTSNGVSYLYSEKYMTKAHANSLAEWEEVERHENP